MADTKQIEQLTNWLDQLLDDKAKRTAIRRASTFDDFSHSWDISAMLGSLKLPVTKQILASVWGASTAKKTCAGSLANIARKHGINERRWHKLTSTRDRVEAARQVRRIARQLPAVPTEDVIQTLYYWGSAARRRWAMQWFQIDEEVASDDT